VQYQQFGDTGWNVSRIGFGAWAIGADWGIVSEEAAMAALHAAFEHGVNFIDTADVYGDGRSERLAARLRKERPNDDVVIATKAGRRLDPHVADGYNRANLTAFIDRSLTNLDTDTIDLVQLHCPPTDVYYQPEVFGVLDDLVTAGKILHYGVSVEKVEEGIKALEYPGVQSVQIIYNMFRQRPAERFFALAKERNVAILARVPLASGLLTGKMTAASSFAANDHRNYNRAGEAFDVGETFAGVPFDVGLEAVDRLRDLFPAGLPMAKLALRWILMNEAVTLAIPGAKNPEQAIDNASAADVGALKDAVMEEVLAVYDELIKPHVHQRW
jgi:aryl-alcohol dehydrogenase-like predicted oxidoreductase